VQPYRLADRMSGARTGPLTGVKVIEMAGIGPTPFATMLLADMGADVVRVDRPVASDLGLGLEPRFDTYNRNKRLVSVDLKSPDGLEAVKRLIGQADILIEGFRPGVMERLGLGPDVCLGLHSRLVYGRMTGWGQTGALAQTAGHDLNYIALSGALHAIGPENGPPVVPLNLIGDLGGGALYLAMGVLAALTEARSSGRGQVVDAAIVDGVTSMMSMFYALRQMEAWTPTRGQNLLDGGAPFYALYETLDGGHVSVAAVEGKFYRELLDRLGLADADLPKQNDRRHWPAMRERFAVIFGTRSRDDWTAVFAGSDACFAPVLDLDEAMADPVAGERAMFGTLDAVVQPAPAPRFDRTPGTLRTSAPDPAGDSTPVLSAWGFSADEIDRLKAARAIDTRT
jgi:alpha-methylacyl-CoA racemase